MQNYNIYIIDDDKRKRVLLPILVDMLNENATHNGFEFHDGFCGDSDSRHKDPEFLINAFDDDYGVFLLDLSFSVEVGKYKSAYEKLKDIMRTDNENNFSEIDKQYNRYKEIWPEDQWDFIAWLLAVCKIKNKKTFLITINKKQVAEDPSFEKIAEGIKPVFFPARLEQGDSFERKLFTNTKRKLVKIAGAINEYCLSLSYEKIDWEEFLKKVTTLNIHPDEKTGMQSNDEKEAINSLKGFLQMAGAGFDKMFLADNRLKKFWVEPLKSLANLRGGPLLHVGWLLGFGIHRSMFSDREDKYFDKIWNAHEVAKIDPSETTVLFKYQKEDKIEYFTKTLEKYCELCIKLFKYDSMREEKRGDDILTKVEFEQGSLSFFTKISFADLCKQFRSYNYDRLYKNKKVVHDTSKAIFEYWSLVNMDAVPEKNGFFVSKNYFNVKRTDDGMTKVSF